MAKDYKVWHELKTRVNKRPPQPLFHEREIWWCSLGEIIGLPLTTKVKDNQYYYPVEVGGLQGSIIISQLRTFSSRRLQRKLERLGKQSFAEVLERTSLTLLKRVVNKSDPLHMSAGGPRVPSGNLYSNTSMEQGNGQDDIQAASTGLSANHNQLVTVHKGRENNEV